MQELVDLGMAGLGEGGGDEGRGVPERQEELHLVLGEEAAEGRDLDRRLGIDLLPLEDPVHHAEDVGVAQHQPVGVVLVENRVEQDFAGFGRRGLSGQVLHRLAQKHPVFSGARHLDALLSKGVGVLQKRLHQPFRLGAMGADVDRDLHGCPGRSASRSGDYAALCSRVKAVRPGPRS